MLIFFILFFFIIILIVAALRKKTIPLKIITGNSEKKIRVELADNLLKKIIGLMFRKEISSDGMIFLFDKSDNYGLWMLFTSIPLDAIFIAEDYTVNEIISLKPQSTKTVYPAKPCKYLLEVEKGSLKVIPGKTKILLPTW